MPCVSHFPLFLSIVRWRWRLEQTAPLFTCLSWPHGWSGLQYWSEPDAALVSMAHCWVLLSGLTLTWFISHSMYSCLTKYPEEMGHCVNSSGFTCSINNCLNSSLPNKVYFTNSCLRIYYIDLQDWFCSLKLCPKVTRKNKIGLVATLWITTFLFLF